MIKKKILFAFHNPGYALCSLFREALFADERFIGHLTGHSAWRIRTLLIEPFRDPWFRSHITRCAAILDKLQQPYNDPMAKKVLIPYAICRALRPDIVVETGVAHGVSSAYLLFALSQNGKGRLHSIDIGDRSFLPSGRGIGWIIPDGLRDRWILHMGDSKVVLPQIVQGVGPIDMFIHDSLHTYEHMMFEFRCVWSHLSRGGILLADDALWNGAFRDFAHEVGVRRLGILRGVGVLKKDSR